MSTEVDGERFSLLDAISNDLQQHEHQRSSRLLLAGALEATPSAASQLARFLSAFQASHGDSVSGVTFVVNGSAFEAFVEAPTEALFRLMQALSDHCAVAAASSGGSASSTRPSTRQPLPARAASSSSPSSRFSPPAWGLCGVCWVKVLSFVEATPRVFPFFAVRALRVAAAPEDWPTPSPSYSAAPPAAGGRTAAPSTLPQPPHSASPLLPLTFATLQALLALGEHVAALGEAGEEFVVSGVSRALLDKVVSVERVQGYGQCGELMDARDFVDAFVRRVQGKPESERNWPVEEYITF